VAVKTPFIVVYDYGQGGVWAYVWAESGAQIMQFYPELSVVNELPEGIAGQRLPSYDLSQPSGLLADIIAGRR
jgi:hypothetical protein